MMFIDPVIQPAKIVKEKLFELLVIRNHVKKESQFPESPVKFRLSDSPYQVKIKHSLLWILNDSTIQQESSTQN